MGFNKLISEGDDFLRQYALDQYAQFERVIETLRPDGVISNEELDRQLTEFRDRTEAYLLTLKRPKPLPETTVD